MSIATGGQNTGMSSVGANKRSSSSLVENSIAGAGVGLRMPHLGELLADADSEQPQRDIPWLELLADNWLAPGDQPLGGINRELLEAVSERFALTLHGVGLSLGSCGELDMHYLQQIKQLQNLTGAHWYSEHCSFSWENQRQHYAPDLLPLPYTDEAVMLLAQHIRQVQDFMGEPLLLENVSSYVQYQHSHLTEAEFINAVLSEADCLLLLDINNVYVTSFNEIAAQLAPAENQSSVDRHSQSLANMESKKSAARFLQQMPHQRVQEIHLAGHEAIDHTGHHCLLDTHNQPVCSDVWDLYQGYIAQQGPRATLIEWDSDLPTLAQLDDERRTAQSILDNSTSQARLASVRSTPTCSALPPSIQTLVT